MLDQSPAPSGKPIANKLLAAFSRSENKRLLTGCEPIALPFGRVLHEPGKQIRDVYFPINCLVSLVMADGHRSSEVGLVGYEGMVGISLALGVHTSPVTAVVHGAGTVFRVPSGRFNTEHGKSGRMRRELNHYIHTFVVQISQTAVCNVSHSVESRLARWLLMMRDRMGTNHFSLTQEMLGYMLGVLRVAVTLAAGNLQRRKLISSRRGTITIVDERGLEAAACRCYKRFAP